MRKFVSVFCVEFCVQRLQNFLTYTFPARILRHTNSFLSPALMVSLSSIYHCTIGHKRSASLQNLKQNPDTAVPKIYCIFQNLYRFLVIFLFFCFSQVTCKLLPTTRLGKLHKTCPKSLKFVLSDNKVRALSSF